MKPPEEIKVDGGKLVRLYGDGQDLAEGAVVHYTFRHNPPMPELKAGMYCEVYGNRMLVLKPCKYSGALLYDGSGLIDVSSDKITAVYDRNEQEIWRK